MDALELAAGLGLAGAAVCLLVAAAPGVAGLRRRAASRLERWLALERRREQLAQAGLDRLSVTAWLLLRAVAAALAAVLAQLVFGVPVLGLVAGLVCYHLLGLALELRRRQRQLERQQALLEAIRYGAAVMSRGGSATDMLKALAGSGPLLARPLFAELAEPGAGLAAEPSHPAAVARLRDRLAEPMFDDFALAILLHWSQGAKLVPALDAVVEDWEQSLVLQREAKVMRAGVEASVLILTLLPVVFLGLLQLLSPELLMPFHSTSGQVVLGLAVLWMVLGYRVLARMAEPPQEQRLRLRSTGR